MGNAKRIVPARGAAERDAVRADVPVQKSRLKLHEIATKIYAHLKRFEADPKINGVESGMRPYYMPNAHAAGARVFVSYVSFQGSSSMKREEALQYLEWLDAGNVGKHWRMR